MKGRFSDLLSIGIPVILCIAVSVVLGVLLQYLILWIFIGACTGVVLGSAFNMSYMKSIVCFFITMIFTIGFLLTAAMALYLPDIKIGSTATTVEFTEFLDSRVPRLMDQYGVPGASIALIQDGKIVHTAAFGYAEKGTGRKMTEDMPMRVQSISKSVTAWAVMKLAEEGKLKLEDPVEKYLGDWKIPESKYPSEGVTIKRLLCHTSGLPLGDIFAICSPGEDMPSLKENLTRTANLFQMPGRGFSYSNVGYNLLELLIEEVTGRDFGEYMKDVILYPLGMYSSDFEWNERNLKTVPLGYTLNGTSVSPYQYPERASGGLIATAEDIARFCIAGMPDFSEKRVLSEKSIEQLYLTQAENLGVYSMVFDAYGFGYYTEQLSGDKLAVSHGGQGTGWMSHFHSVPETGDGIVILTNCQRSWPLIAGILNAWSRWRGFSSPGMTCILLGECALWGLVGLIVGSTICFILKLAIKIKEGNFKINLMPHYLIKPKQILKIIISISILSVIFWAMFQRYLFLTSVFPVSSIWLEVCSAVFSITMLIETLFGRNNL